MIVAGSVPLGAIPAAAATLTVCLSGQCDFTSIAAAVESAAAGDTILVEPDDYEELIDIATDLTIAGNGAGVTVRPPVGANESLVNVSSSTVTFRDMTFADAVSDGSGAGILAVSSSITLDGVTMTGATSGTSGGAVYGNGSNVTVIDSAFIGNQADRRGGAIAVVEADVTIRSSYFASNSAWGSPGVGGAVSVSGNLDLESSTFTGNGAIDGSAIWAFGDQHKITTSTIHANFAEVAGAVYFSGGLEVTESTITSNSGSNGGAFHLATDFSFANFVSNIVFDNAVDNSGNACTIFDGGDPLQYYSSSGFNFLPDENACGFPPVNSDIIGVDPGLGDLAGSPLPVRTPIDGSPVIDAGDVTGSGFDQLGTPRPQGDAYDIGAIEVGGSQLPVIEPIDTSVAEASTSVLVPVNLSEATMVDVTFDWATEPGSATEDEDYVGTSGTGLITEGETQTFLEIPILDDDVFEGDESFTVVLSNPENASILDSSALVVIADNESPNQPPIAVDDSIVSAVDTSIFIFPTLNDTDPDGDALRIADFTAADGGTLASCDTTVADGGCVYYPGLNGGSFQYVVTDEVDSDTGLVTVTALSDFGAEGTATIDGVLSPGEWDGASTLEMYLTDGVNESVGTAYLMNDGSNLSMAFVVDDMPAAGAWLEVHFDDPSNDAVRIDGSGYRDGVANPNFVNDDIMHGSGARVVNGTTITYEFSKPLDSGDSIDISTGPGSVMGFSLEVRQSPDGEISNLNLAPTGQVIEWLNWQIVGAAVTNPTLALSTSSLPTGFAVPLVDVPVERLIAAAESVAGVDLESVGIAASPLGSIPLGSIPLGSIATGSAATVVLSDVTIAGGWGPLLEGTTLESRPLQTITLAEALETIPADRLATLELADLDLSDTGAATLSLAALVLGDATLAELGLTCPASATGCDENTSSVLDVEAAGSKVTSAPLGSIPLGSIPLGSIPLGSIPLGSIPLGSIPLGSIPLGSIPLGSIGDLAAAPLGSIPLGSIPLGSIPLGSIDLDAVAIAGLPLGSIPLGSIDVGADFCSFHDAVAAPDESCAALGIDPNLTTLSEYLGLLGASDLASTPLGSIPLGSIPLGSIPLGSISLAGIPLGSIPLGSIDLAASPLGSIPLGSIPLGSITITEVCDATNTTPCDDTTTLAAWASGLPNGTDVASTPLGSIQIDTLPLGSIPLGSIDLNTVEIAGVPLGSIPLGSIDLAGSPLGSIPLGSIAGVDALVDCGLVDCTTDDLATAAALGALRTGTTLGALIAALSAGDLATLTLADVLDHLGLAFLGDIPELDGLTLGELLVPTLVATALPWEEFPLETIEVRDTACGFNETTRTCKTDTDSLEVTASFDVVGGTLDVFSGGITLPSNFLSLPRSAQLVGPGGTQLLAEPVVSGGEVRFRLKDLEPGSYQLSIVALPGFDLETVTITADIGGSILVSDAVTVVQKYEPNDVGGEVVAPDTLYVSHVASAGDVDSWIIPAPGEGSRLGVYLSNLDGDVDTFLYRPDTAPVSGAGTERNIPLGSVPVEDEGVDPIGGSLEPEVLADTAEDDGRTLAAASTARGGEGEALSVVQDDDAITNYTVEVSGYNGASSDRPYVLRVTYSDELPVSACTPRPYPAITPGGDISVPAGSDTLFLVNRDRMQAVYGDISTVESLLQSVATFSGPGATVNGALIDIADIPGVASAFGAWDANPCDPGSANDVVGAITAFIQTVAAANPSLRHVTVVGSDEMVPFFRAQDTTVVANESTYTDGFSDNALFGALSTGHYLSDTPYGDLDPVPWLDRYAYVPELAVGRLVEDPSQIATALQAFIDNGGVLDPGSAATAGYDFLSDGAQEIDSTLATFLASTSSLISETWTRSDLVNEFAGGADIVSPNAHYDHYRALPAIGNLTGSEADLFTIDDLAGIDLTSRIVFTMGCHAGLNVDGTTGGVTNPDDWAEVYGGQRAVYIGNTGYGYGDSSTVALTEELMVNFSERLDGSYTVGQALADAKQEQFGKAGLYGIYDLKAIEEATLYGLPFWNIDGPGVATIPNTETGVIAVDPITGLDRAPFSTAPSFTSVTTADGTYWSSDEGTQFLHWRPIQPLTGLEVGVDGRVATGTLLTGLTSQDQVVADAVFARPNTTDVAGREPEIESDGVIFPTSFAAVSTFSQINPDVEGPPAVRRQRVNLIAGQYIDTGASSIQRLFTQMQGAVFYIDEADVAEADFTPPSIVSVDGSAAGDQAIFRVVTGDADSGVARVTVLYVSDMSGGSAIWSTAELQLDAAGTTWIGGGPVSSTVAQPIPYIVQAVNGSGVVGVSTNKEGAYQTVSGQAVSPPDAVDDVASTTEGTSVPIAVLTNDVDPDGDLDPTSLEVVSDPAHGTAEAMGAAVLYTPEDGFSGSDTFTYQVCDLTGLCDTAEVTVAVIPLTSPPDAVDDEATAIAGEPTSIDVLANDVDADGDLDPDSLAVTMPAAHGTTDVIGQAVTYTADADYEGPDTFGYTVCDLAGACDDATVTVQVSGQPVAPEAVDDLQTVPVGSTVDLDVLGNDTDTNGDLDPDSLQVAAGPLFGTATASAGLISYTAGDLGLGYDTLDYEVCDLSGLCDRATVDLLIVGAGTAPTATDDVAYAIDGPVTVFVLDNDSDADGDLDVSSLEVIDITGGVTAEVTSVDGIGALNVTPGADGTATVTYSVCDLNGSCSEAKVTVYVGLEQCTIVGTDGADLLFGTNGSDVICALDGNDLVFALRGNDVVIAGSGNDTVFGGGGADFIDGGEGNDGLDGQDGVDVILGGPGDDAILGGTHSDRLQGNSGDDVVTGGIGNDTIWLGTGIDTGYGSAGADTIIGNLGGPKTIGGGSSADLLIGGPANDVIAGGWGADRIESGGGDDVVFGGLANDSIDSGAGNDLVLAGGGHDTVYGGIGNDVLITETGDDTIFGGPGDDEIVGGANEDIAYGGTGIDSCDAETTFGCP